MRELDNRQKANPRASSKDSRAHWATAWEHRGKAVWHPTSFKTLYSYYYRIYYYFMTDFCRLFLTAAFAHNLSPLKRNDRKEAWVCAQHPFSGRTHHPSQYETLRNSMKPTFQHSLQCMMSLYTRIIHH